VSREIFEVLNPQGGQRTSLVISLVCAVVLAVASLILTLLYTALLFGSLAYCSWVLLQATASQPTLGQNQ
jgi:hypothetical protein